MDKITSKTSFGQWFSPINLKVFEEQVKTKNYAKEIKGKEFVPNGEYELTSAIGGGTVWIDGYFKDNPSKKS